METDAQTSGQGQVDTLYAPGSSDVTGFVSLPSLLRELSATCNADGSQGAQSSGEGNGEELRGWSPVCSSSGAPSARGYSTGVSHEGSLWVFGGSAGSSRKNDLQRFDLSTRTWNAVEFHGDPPSARNSHSAVVYCDCLYVFGGWDGSRNCNDLFECNLKTSVWRAVSTTGLEPNCRRGHTSIVSDHTMYTFGGWDGGRNFNDFHAISLKNGGFQWAPVTVSNGQAPTGRRGHSGVEYSGVLYFFGGQDGSSFYNDLHQFDTENGIWSVVQCTAGLQPVSRSYHTAAMHNTSMYIFGGTGINWCFYNDLHAFDFVARSWRLVQFSGSVPSPRCFHTAVVEGDRLFIFGGARLTKDAWDYFNHLYQFCIESSALCPSFSDPPSSTLQGDLRALLESGEWSDVTFSVEGKKVHAHKAILSARSEYFKSMFTSGMAESKQRVIELRNVRHKVFEALIEFIYTDGVDMTAETAVELMYLASEYQLTGLKRVVEHRITQSITANNVSLIVLAADQHNAIELKRVCQDYIVKEFGRVIVSDSFIALVREHKDLAKEILTHGVNHLCFNLK